MEIILKLKDFFFSKKNIMFNKRLPLEVTGFKTLFNFSKNLNLKRICSDFIVFLYNREPFDFLLTTRIYEFFSAFSVFCCKSFFNIKISQKNIFSQFFEKNENYSLNSNFNINSPFYFFFSKIVRKFFFKTFTKYIFDKKLSESY
jgi:hypothetical protein